MWGTSCRVQLKTKIETNLRKWAEDKFRSFFLLGDWSSYFEIEV